MSISPHLLEVKRYKNRTKIRTKLRVLNVTSDSLQYVFILNDFDTKFEGL